MCTTKLYTYHCGRGKRVKRPCEHSISILPGTIRVIHYSSLAPLPLTHTSAKDYGWKGSMSSSRITRKREKTPFLCRRESPRHEKKLSGDPFLLGAGYAAFAGWGPFRGPVPTGGYFEKRPPRARNPLIVNSVFSNTNNNKREQLARKGTKGGLQAGEDGHDALPPSPLSGGKPSPCL